MLMPGIYHGWFLNVTTFLLLARHVLKHVIATAAGTVVKTASPTPLPGLKLNFGQFLDCCNFQVPFRSSPFQVSALLSVIRVSDWLPLTSLTVSVTNLYVFYHIFLNYLWKLLVTIYEYTWCYTCKPMTLLLSLKLSEYVCAYS